MDFSLDEISTILQYYDHVHYCIYHDTELEEVKNEMFTSFAIVDDDEIDLLVLENNKKRQLFDFDKNAKIFIYIGLFVLLLSYKWKCL